MSSYALARGGGDGGKGEERKREENLEERMSSSAFPESAGAAAAPSCLTIEGRGAGILTESLAYRGGEKKGGNRRL